MLKRIAGWYAEAERLCDDILDGTPAQYREHALMRAKYRDDERRARLTHLLERDPVAARWIEAQHDVIALAHDLHGLAAEIEWRAKRRGPAAD